MSSALHRTRHQVRRHARDRLFARRIDVRKEHAVGGGERFTEGVGKIAGAREEMGLERRDYSATRVRRPRGLERRGDLRGMVSVVVDDRHAASIPKVLEAAIHSAKL